MPCVYRAPPVPSVILCWVMTLQSSEQHITLEQLSAPSGGLSTLMSIHESGKIQRKLGRQVALLSLCCTITQFYCHCLLHLQREEIQVSLQSGPPGAQVPSMVEGHLPISRASLAASKAGAASNIIDCLVQLCPSCDLQASYFLSRCITSLSLEAVWKVWTWPGGWKSGSNYPAIQWEEALRQFACDLVKVMARNKFFSTNERSSLLKSGSVLACKASVSGSDGCQPPSASPCQSCQSCLNQISAYSFPIRNPH